MTFGRNLTKGRQARVLTALTAGVIVCSLSAMNAAPVTSSVARSNSPFKVYKASAGQTLPANSVTTIQPGDKVTAGADHVRIGLSESGDVVLDKGTSVAVSDNTTVSLEAGRLLSAARTDSLLSVLYEDLKVIPATSGESTTTDAPRPIVHVEKIADGLVEVEGLQGTHLVQDAKTGVQVAVVGAGDAIQFLRSGGSWIIEPLMQDDPGQPTLIGEQEQGVDSAEGRDEGAGIWWVAGGVVAGGAAIAGGVIAINELNDDDDDDDDDENFFFGPTSPIAGGPTP